MVPPLSALSIMEPLSLPNQKEPCKVEKIVLVPPDWKMVLVPPFQQIAPKMCDFQQSHKICILEDHQSNIFTFGSLIVGAYMR